MLPALSDTTNIQLIKNCNDLDLPNKKAPQRCFILFLLIKDYYSGNFIFKKTILLNISQ